MFWIDKNAPIPLHYQLRKAIEQEIVSGRLAPGSMLPTEAELCAQLDISRTTVRTAIRDLAQEGLVTRIPARGTFVAQPRAVRHTIVVAAFAIAETPGPGADLFFWVWEGIDEAAKACKLNVAVRRSIARGDERTSFINQIASEPSTFGVAVFTWNQVDWDHVRHVHSTGFPYVLINRYIPGRDDVPAVTLDDRDAVIQAVHRLYEMGHRRILFLGLINPQSTAHKEREEGYLEAMHALGLGKAAHIARIKWTRSMDTGEIASIIGEGKGYSACIAASGDAAAAVATEARMLGIRVPEDFSIISFEDSSRVSERHPGITTIDYAPKQIGKSVVDLLRRQAAGDFAARRRVKISTAFIERGSCAPHVQIDAGA